MSIGLPSSIRSSARKVGAYNRYLVPPVVSDCPLNDSRYTACQQHHAIPLLANANVNVARIETTLQDLQNGDYPEELGPVRAYLISLQEFFLWRARQLAKYLEIDNVEVLETSFETLDPRVVLSWVKFGLSRREMDDLGEHQWTRRTAYGMQRARNSVATRSRVGINFRLNALLQSSRYLRFLNKERWATFSHLGAGDHTACRRQVRSRRASRRHRPTTGARAAQSINQVMSSPDSELAFWVVVNTTRKAVDDKRAE